MVGPSSPGSDPAPGGATGRAPRWLGPLRLALGAAALAALLVLLVLRRGTLAEVASAARPGWLAAALVASLAQLGWTSAFWTSGLRALHEPVGRRQVLAATAASVAARYLPGSVWYAVSRAARLRGQGVAAAPLAAVATLETLLSPLVGLLLGLALLGLAGTVAGDGALPLPAWVLVAGAAAGVLLAPLLLDAALAAWARRQGRRARRLGVLPGLRLVGWSVLFWLSSAGTFVLFAQAFVGGPAAGGGEGGGAQGGGVLGGAGPLTLAGAYAVAWAVGWLALLAPQGLGVFEVTLAALVGAPDVATAAVVVAGWRVVVLVRDLAVTAAAPLLDGGVRRAGVRRAGRTNGTP